MILPVKTVKSRKAGTVVGWLVKMVRLRVAKLVKEPAVCQGL